MSNLLNLLLAEKIRQRGQERDQARATEAFGSMIGGNPANFGPISPELGGMTAREPFEQQDSFAQAQTLGQLNSVGGAGPATVQGLIAPQMPLTQQQQGALDLQQSQMETERQRQLLLSVQTQAAQRDANFPSRVSIPIIEPGSNQLAQRMVDSPSSEAYGTRVTNMTKVFTGLRDLNELVSIATTSGTEFAGVDASRAEALQQSGTLAYAVANDMGALQEPDLDIVRGVIPDITGLGENLESIARVPGSVADAVLSFATGSDVTTPFGLAAQRKGYQKQIDVAREQIWEKVSIELARNPLLLNDIQDKELELIPPDFLPQVVHEYLALQGRDPWG